MNAIASGTGLEHVDVLIVGAGISGIGAAHHLQTECPGKTFLLVDSLDHFGGTWWTHTYPGVRSDSDLFTFGYRFKPWKGAPLASAEEILKYLGEVIEENDLEERIRYRHRVTSAEWDTDHRAWTVELRRLDNDETVRLTTDFLWMCQGYYRHDTGYTPEWPGLRDTYTGRVIHPQRWPADTDLSGQRVVVIGSGATAATLIPAIADQCEHVTMLQRSPTFFFVRPNSNELADTLRSLDIPDEWTHEIVRRKIVKDGDAIAKLSAQAPDLVRQGLLDQIRPLLPEGFDVEKHFSPTYRPWQQRIAVLPDGDLFTKIREGKASVVTDHIDSFTETGIRLAGGDELDADVVITATGFDLSVLGDIAFTVDGQPVDAAETVTYRGVMFTGVPNLAYVFGYFRASWTLRADLIADFVCRLLNHMDAEGSTMVVPALREDEADMVLGPWVDPDEFNPGYLTRSMHLMPKQGDRDPWRLLHDYTLEQQLLPNVDLEDGALVFK
ncbi:MAG TPA: NAD(P)/FAD-dependent oxidoreductase [Acidimicrobiales bacterium]|nr:NAD(P)/FAD-dependent oxidoreductase [Acidimicrobiales bacterium]